MRRARTIFMVLVATMIATSVLAQIRIIPQEKRDSIANPPTVKCEDMLFENGRSVDFGTMAEDGGNQVRNIRWRNSGTAPITITRITTSCGCVRCDFDRKPIASGGQSNITITYVPQGHPGVMRQRIFVYTDRSSQMPTSIIDIKGNVTASADRRGDYPYAIGALLLRTREIRFDADTEGTQTMRIACMNGGTQDLTPSKDAMLSSENITIFSEPKSLRAGEQGEIVVRYTPTANGNNEPLRLFVENRNLPPRDRKIEIITKTKKRQ